MTDVAPTLVQAQPIAAGIDPEDLRVGWSADRWELSSGGGATRIVPPASLSAHAPAPVVASAASDPGQGGFNPFMDTAASAPAATPDENGLPWTSIAIAVVLLASAAGAFAMRARSPKTVLRKPADY